MLITPPTPFRRHRSHSTGNLELVWATYDVGSSITLKFNQPIDISALNGPAISVNDVLNGTKFVGSSTSVERVDPFTVRVSLEEDDSSSGTVTTMSATNDTRIRTIPGAQSWAGATDLPLPFP